MDFKTSMRPVLCLHGIKLSDLEYCDLLEEYYYETDDKVYYLTESESHYLRNGIGDQRFDFICHNSDLLSTSFEDSDG